MALVQIASAKARSQSAGQGRPGRRMIPALALLVAAALSAGSALAAGADCARHFWQGSAPALTNPKLSAQTRQICYTGYAVLHSGVTRTPLWSAEHLTRDGIAKARALMRVDAFHPDPNLPKAERAELSDYSGSGFDRGHMAPAGDMGTPKAMADSFSLANMIPQDPELNRGLWEKIERATRGLAEDQGEVYVVTGPIFQGQQLQSLDGRVLVPTDVFKAIYSPSTNTAGAYLVQNRPGTAYRAISLAELQQIAGIDPFPALPQAVKQTAAELPAPALNQVRDGQRMTRPPSRRSRRPATEAESPGANPSGDFVGGILDAISQFGNNR